MSSLTTRSSSPDELVRQLNTDPTTGLTTDQAAERREEDGCFNVVDPPINCPAWVCCLLPCIKSIPSMKIFRMIKPEEAEVLRNGKWVRYDAASLVRGDVIRMEEGDIVPADSVVLSVHDDQMLVDSRHVTGDDKPTSCEKQDSNTNTCQPVQLYMGSHVVEGSGEAVVTAIGPHTFLAQVIRDKQFPPPAGNTSILRNNYNSDPHHYSDAPDDVDPEVAFPSSSSSSRWINSKNNNLVVGNHRRND